MTSGIEACHALSDARDARVVDLAAKHGAPPDLSILAVGGYGRRELAPRSDLDLLFLAADPDAVAPVVEAILHDLWDQRLQIGFATRNEADTVALAAEDLHTATGLLTARTLVGDDEARHALMARLFTVLGGSRTDAVLADLEAGISARHDRYGGSVYLLEPNLKQSPGGLRDLQVLLWAAILVHRVRGYGDLLARGVCSPRVAREVHRARDFLLRVRNVLHEVAPYGGDRLTFEHQEAVAATFGFGHDRHAVEQFMARYYEHASAVKRHAALVLRRAREIRRPRKPALSRKVDAHFRIFDGHLTFDDPTLFEKDPRQLMRLFAVAQAHGVPIYGHAKARVLEAVPTLDDAWRADPVVVEAFKQVLSSPDDPHDALGDLHETGALGACVPEFGAVTHRTQHDLYHVYTVDIHTLHAVRKLKALHRGDLSDEQPLLTAAMAQVGDPFALYLGLLMHDAGKALGRGHAVKGARLVPPVGQRLGLPRRQTRDAAWLVRDHLLMAHLSQRRDLSDDGLIRRFCRQVGSEENLARLFVLTWADASTTGPQAYTDWKASLLAELYARGSQRMRIGLDLYEDPKRRVRRLRRVVTDWLLRNGDPRVGDVNSSVDRFFGSLPTEYFARTRARDIARHLELLERLADEPPLVFDVVPRPRRAYAWVHVAATDRPGLLGSLCGVFSAHRLDVFSAEINVTDDGNALYVFRVREADAAPTDDAARWQPVRDDLHAVLAGEVEVDALIERAHPTAGRFAWPAGPAVEANIRVDQTTHGPCTVIEVHGRDRPGLLFSIVRVLERAEVPIVLARITTEGDAAHDTFYLDKLSDERTSAVVAALRAVL